MIEQLASQIFNDIKDKISQTENAEDLSSSKIKAIIESQLKKMNLVTRDEFDAQQSVLKKTREKLEELEQQLNALENEILDSK